jgi:hypothetical protein
LRLLAIAGYDSSPRLVSDHDRRRFQQAIYRTGQLNQLAGVLDVPLLWLIAGAESPPGMRLPDLSETTAIESKLRRAENLVNELSALLVDIRGQTRRVQRDIDADQNQDE